MPENRDHDVVVFGATGFVGRLIAAYLAEHAPADTRIALAGRSEEKLARARAKLPARAHDWPLVVADADADESLAALARSTRVVATTVGPYRRSGLPLVDACIAAGTDYADLAGEVLFVRETAKRHDAAAAAGARIVHSTGFDSIPSDLGVLALHERAQADGAGELGATTLVVKSMRGGFSGGTVDSMRQQIDEITKDKEARRAVGDPYALSPDRSGEPDPGDGDGDMRGVQRDDDAGWIAPFVMATYNTRVVRRSNALTGWSYGRGFRYREVSGVGSGPLAPVKGAAMAGGLIAVAGGFALPPTRKLLDRLLPDPGEGPSEESRRKGSFRIDIHTTTSTGARYVAHVAAQGDPGYAATSVMMGESALCLALDHDRLPGGGGVLTPSTAMGSVLTDRLRAAGMTFSVEPRPAG